MVEKEEEEEERRCPRGAESPPREEEEEEESISMRKRDARRARGQPEKEYTLFRSYGLCAVRGRIYWELDQRNGRGNEQRRY